MSPVAAAGLLRMSPCHPFQATRIRQQGIAFFASGWTHKESSFTDAHFFPICSTSAFWTLILTSRENIGILCIIVKFENSHIGAPDTNIKKYLIYHT
jgi:hypothetical protein